MCDFKSLYKANVARHEKLKHGRGGGDVLKCSLCTYTTENEAALNMHTRMSHNNGSRDHACGTCGFSTKFLGALRRHNTMVHAGR